MDALENIAAAPAELTVPGADIVSPASRTLLTINRRQPTNVLRTLLAFANPSLRNFLSNLVNQAKLDYRNPRPTAQQLRDANAALAASNAANAALQSRIDYLVAYPPLGVTPAPPSPIVRPDPAHQAEITALTTERDQLQDQLHSITVARDALALQVSTHETTIATLQTTNQALSTQIDALQSVAPVDSISNANTATLTNPTPMEDKMFLAASAAYLASTGHPGIRILQFTPEYMRTRTANNTASVFEVLANHIDGIRALARHRETQPWHDRMTATRGQDGTHLSDQSPDRVDELSLLIAAVRLHSQEDRRLMATSQHLTCTFGRACFIARSNRERQSNPQLPEIVVFQLSYLEFVNTDLQPRRYPVTYSRFLSMIRSHTTLRTITDAVSRSRTPPAT